MTCLTRQPNYPTTTTDDGVRCVYCCSWSAKRGWFCLSSELFSVHTSPHFITDGEEQAINVTMSCEGGKRLTVWFWNARSVFLAYFWTHPEVPNQQSS